MLMEDGSELPAEVVLRDKDLDLAFVRPKTKPSAPLPALDLAKSGPAQILDQLITLNRLHEAVGRTYSVSVERISAIVRTPRLFYVPDGNQTSTTLGSPAFSLDGKVVGIVLMRTVKSRGSSGGMFDFQPGNNMSAIILPTDSIQRAAKQVPERK
jgi:S1-C subfamily serine protease